MDRLNIPLPKVFLRQSQIDDYMDLEARSQELLRDRSYGFVLLHLPVPHPWGIYDRHTGKFTTASSSSYTDNLALADKCLAGIRQTLEQTGQWDSSTVVVMGDHGWRTKQEWKTSSFWTHEDEVASHGGQYDPRPAYLVKLPNQTTAGRVDTPYQTVNTRKLFDAIMAHQINTPADLTAWAQTAH
jgi:arylsulfatase A-like enzyme